MAAALLGACTSAGGDPSPRRSESAAPPGPSSEVAGSTTEIETPDVAAAPDPSTVAEDDPVVGAEASRASVAASPRPSSRRSATGDRIDIPKIGLSHPTFEGIDLKTINRGPSHWPGTALPGERGNTVFPGHRTTYTKPFWDIDKLVPGDEVIFTTAAGRFTYAVTETLVVGARDTWITRPTEEATFTIFACHPKGSARQRYVVKGRLVSPPRDATTGTTTAPSSTTTSTAPTTTTSAPPQDQPILPPLPG